MLNLADKTCLNCHKQMQPRGAETLKSDRFMARIFCSDSCSRVFRKRQRHNRPHPDEVMAEIKKRKDANRLDLPSENRDQVTIYASQGPYWKA